MRRLDDLFSSERLGAYLALTLLTACGGGDPNRVAPDESAAPFEERELVTYVQGYLFDPEGMFVSGATCTSECGGWDPELSTETPHLPRVLLTGGTVSVLDSFLAPTPQEVSAASDAAGIWNTRPVPSRPYEQPYYLLAEGAAAVAEGPNPEAAFPIPAAAAYLPTINLRPMPAVWSSCMYQPAMLLPRNGVLEAVATWLTRAGTPTSVDDLIDPSRYASVTVVAAQRPIFFINVTPADQTTAEATVGQVLNIDWAPPGEASLSAEQRALQSERGFFVTSEETSRIGWTVTLVPPGTAEVVISLKDSLADEVLKRPWSWPEIRYSPRPGVITFTYAYPVLPPGFKHIDLDYDPWPWPYMCQQETYIKGGF